LKLAVRIQRLAPEVSTHDDKIVGTKPAVMRPTGGDASEVAVHLRQRKRECFKIKNALHCKNLTQLNNAKPTHLCCHIVNEFGV
jgi:hypothetical protein